MWRAAVRKAGIFRGASRGPRWPLACSAALQRTVEGAVSHDGRGTEQDRERGRDLASSKSNLPVISMENGIQTNLNVQSVNGYLLSARYSNGNMQNSDARSRCCPQGQGRPAGQRRLLTLHVSSSVSGELCAVSVSWGYGGRLSLGSGNARHACQSNSLTRFPLAPW